MEDAGTSEEGNIDSQDTNIRIDHGHQVRNCSIKILVPEFAVEDMSLDRNATLVPEFAVKDLALGQNTLMMMMMILTVTT